MKKPVLVEKVSGRPSTVVGENAAQKLSRLLGRYNRAMIAEGSGDFIGFSMIPSGTCRLTFCEANSIGGGEILFETTDIDGIIGFLQDKTPLEQLLAAVEWASSAKTN